MPACGNEFYLLVFNSISHEFAALTPSKIKFVSTPGHVISSISLGLKQPAPGSQSVQTSEGASEQ